VNEGPARIQEIIEYGTRFDKTIQGIYDLAKEGGHSEHRVLHYKDVTGFEIERALLEQVHNNPNIEILTHFIAVELITQHHCGKLVDKRSDDIECYGIYDCCYIRLKFLFFNKVIRQNQYSYQRFPHTKK